MINSCFPISVYTVPHKGTEMISGYAVLVKIKRIVY